jgi:hypothetical protein
MSHTAEPPIRHDDQVFTFLVIAVLGASRAAGDGFPAALPRLFQP